MNKTDVVFDKAFKPNQDAPTILEPGQQPLHFPASTITVEISRVLGLGLLLVRKMRGYQIHSILSWLCVQRIAVIHLVTDQTLGRLFCEPCFQSRFYEGALMQRGAANGYDDRKTRVVCRRHDLCTFAPLGFSHPLAPLFAMTKAPSMNYSVKSRLPRSFHVLCRGLQNHLKHTGATPFLEASMARLVWGAALCEIFPLCICAHDPQNAVEYLSIVALRSTPSIRSLCRCWHEWFDSLPLFIGKIHRLVSILDLSQSLPFLR